MTIDELPEIDPDAPSGDVPSAPGWAGPAVGLLCAVVALTVGALTAALIDTLAPLDAVANEFIDRTPAWLKDLAIQWFDTADKTALRVGMYLTIAALAALAGVLGRRRPWVGVAMIGAFGVLAALVAAGRPDGDATAAVPPMVGAMVAAGVFWWLIGLVRAGDGPSERPARPRDGFDRRRFLLSTGGAAAGAAVIGATARRVDSMRLDDALQAVPVDLPAPTGTTVPATPAGTPMDPPGATLSPVTPYFTPNAEFYRIDTAASIPRVDVADWRLEIIGRVDRPLTLTYDDLLAREQVERIVTIACVSNEVGGDLIGNAVWQGVLLAPLLEEAGVRPDAEQVFSTSVDGWNCGFPIDVALDGRDAMIAVGMNGEPLPRRHGFPARLVVPGLYGYVSATKWLERIELTTWDEAVGYWIPRGWAREAPIKTQSRIDVPRRGDKPAAGPVVIAGIAWAQHRGITAVEVRVDDGPWQQAELAADVTIDSWRQWRLTWDATPGEHRIQVRATDATGETQTQQNSRPDPDGATGWHTRRITIV